MKKLLRSSSFESCVGCWASSIALVYRVGPFGPSSVVGPQIPSIPPTLLDLFCGQGQTKGVEVSVQFGFRPDRLLKSKMIGSNF